MVKKALILLAALAGVYTMIHTAASVRLAPGTVPEPSFFERLVGGSPFNLAEPNRLFGKYAQTLANSSAEIYEKNWPGASELFNYIDQNVAPELGYINEKTAQLIAAILSNASMRELFEDLYKTDITSLNTIFMLGNPVTIPLVATPFGTEVLGYSREKAAAFSEFMVDFAAWLKDFYTNVYLRHIQDKMDHIFAKYQAADIKAKLNDLFNDPLARGLVLNGLILIAKHWPFIKDSLSTYKFDIATIKNILDKTTSVMKKTVTLVPDITNVSAIVNPVGFGGATGPK